MIEQSFTTVILLKIIAAGSLHPLLLLATSYKFQIFRTETVSVKGDESHHHY